LVGDLPLCGPLHLLLKLNLSGIESSVTRIIIELTVVLRGGALFFKDKEWRFDYAVAQV
jgi:hypothetical protein